jgi:hypothetical protein
MKVQHENENKNEQETYVNCEKLRRQNSKCLTSISLYMIKRVTNTDTKWKALAVWTVEYYPLKELNHRIIILMYLQRIVEIKPDMF